MGRKETAITKKILEWLNDLPRCYAIKRHVGAYGSAGQPDITGCIDGKHFEIEVKADTDATEIQLLTLQKWAHAGAIVAVVYNLEDVQQLFQEEGYLTW